MGSCRQKAVFFAVFRKVGTVGVPKPAKNYFVTMCNRYFLGVFFLFFSKTMEI